MTRLGKTSIQVHLDTKARLDALGKKGETYDEIIRKLLDRSEKRN